MFFRCPAGLPAVNIETKEIILIFLYFSLIFSTLAKLRAPSEQDLLTDCLIDFLSSAALTHDPKGSEQELAALQEYKNTISINQLIN